MLSAKSVTSTAALEVPWGREYGSDISQNPARFGDSDDMVIDVALSKYCDLIPIERYAAIAGARVAPHSPLRVSIQLTHYLADFLALIYAKLREEVLSSRVLHADETPHRMLEGGGDKSSWYLWGFSTPQGSTYFEIRDTRSGDVASELLINSACEFLVSDVFSGYAKAVRKTNEARKELNKPGIANVYCNAHARRKFREAGPVEQSSAFVKLYGRIYRLNKISKTVAEPEKVLRLRKIGAAICENEKVGARANSYLIF